MAILVILLICAACAAFQFLKGSIFKAVVTILLVISASMVAFGFFEYAANFFINRGSDSRFPALVPWAQPLCFALIFIITFAVLQTVAARFTKHRVSFGDLPEQIGRPVVGIILGLLLSGLLFTVLAMAPLPNQYPYPRFDESNPDPENPGKVLLNPDGLVTGLFAMVSRGSMSAIMNPRSFAVVHAGFIDQLFLNRHNPGDDITLVTMADSVEVLKKNGVWYVSEPLVDTDGQPVPARSGYKMAIVRIGISKRAFNDAAKFNTSQLRLICKREADAEYPARGKAVAVYPVGYITTGNQLKVKRLSDQIKMGSADFPRDEPYRYIDFAFYVPSDHVPVMVGFKLNNLVTVPRPVSSDQAPPPTPFVERAPGSDTEAGSSTPATTSSNQPRSTDNGRRGRGLSDVSRSVVGDGFDEN